MRQDPDTRIRVSEEILARFPTFRLRLLYAFGIRNRPSDATTREWLREGATFDSPGSPRLKTLSVTPEETTMVGLGSRRQLKALGV